MALLEIILLSVCAVLCVVITVLGVHAVRRPQTGTESTPASLEVLQADSNLRASHIKLIETFSQRLAATEGRLTAVCAQLEGVAVLRQRLDGLESHMPSVQEAYEKYADQIGRADKRMTERQRRKEKTDPQTAGEAAAQLASVAGVEGGFPAPSATAPAAGNHSTRRPGVLGGGGRR